MIRSRGFNGNNTRCRRGHRLPHLLRFSRLLQVHRLRRLQPLPLGKWDHTHVWLTCPTLSPQSHLHHITKSHLNLTSISTKSHGKAEGEHKAAHLRTRAEGRRWIQSCRCPWQGCPGELMQFSGHLSPIPARPQPDPSPQILILA